MAEPQSGTFAENKNSSSASAAVVKKDAQIQTTLELAVLQENLLRNEQKKFQDHCAVEKLRVTEFLQTSFDHEWQENIFAKLGKFYPWKIQEPDEPSTMQMLTNSEKDLEILENLLTTFPFQTVYSAVQPPVTLPCLSLSTFFDTFMSHRDFIPKTLLRNYSDHALLHVRPQEIPEELFPSRPVSSIEDFELSYNKDGRNVQIEHNNEFGENIVFGNGPKHVISPINMNPEKSRIRYRNFPSMALKSIINRSKISDIFKWRLINKHWNSICCSKLEKLVNPEITLNSENHIKAFLQVSQCPKLTLFSSFSLNQVIVRPPLAAWDFLVRFGPTSIKRLELQHDTLIWVERFRELLQHLPNLEYLSMGITRFRGTRLCPDTPSEIIGAIDLPVLKKLMHVNFYGVGGSFSFHELLQDFFSTFAPNVEIVQANPGEPGLMSKDFREKLICGSLSLRKLKKFDFPISVGELTLKKLGGCRLPLQELILVIKESAIRSEIILKLLSFGEACFEKFLRRN
ncbi:unnamed protein product [Allacma fusca]|uniref:Uncharacterized protein n=1 Tax=Allacma fusca TaxID=39272 RepID=A0A8J2K4C9_9HEXA|nr:unnamed protein product [Allacma fusca]